MVVDAVRTCTCSNRDALPLCCIYNLNKALEFLEVCERLCSTENLREDIAVLAKSGAEYRSHWLI